MDSEIVTIQGAADYARKSYGTIYSWVRNGELPSEVIDGRVMIRVDDLEYYLIDQQSRKTTIGKKSLDMLDIIIHYKERNDGLLPTIRELVELGGYRTTSAVIYHINQLKLYGLVGELDRARGSHNYLVIPGGQWTLEKNDGS